MNLFYTHEGFSSQVYGGVSRNFVELVKHLRMADENSRFRVFAGLYISEYLKGLADFIGFKVPPLKYTGVFRRNINDFFQKLWIKNSDFAIIHPTYYSQLKFSGQHKLVITVHDMIHEFYPDCFSDKGRTSRLKREACSRADRIIAVSEITKKDLVDRFGIDSRKIQVVYHGVSLETINLKNGERGFDDPYILYVGDRHGYKNFRNFILAYSWSRKVNSEFNVVAFGGGPLSKDEKRLIGESGLNGKVMQISGDDSLLSSCYQNARAFIYPSLYEGFGMPPLEAMSCSCPVICSTGGAIPEIVGNAGVYFDPESPESIQEGLEKIIFDDGLLNDMAVRGRERVKEFSWEKCARETLKVYKSLSV